MNRHADSNGSTNVNRIHQTYNVNHHRKPIKTTMGEIIFYREYCAHQSLCAAHN